MFIDLLKQRTSLLDRTSLVVGKTNTRSHYCRLQAKYLQSEILSFRMSYNNKKKKNVVLIEFISKVNKCFFFLFSSTSKQNAQHTKVLQTSAIAPRSPVGLCAENKRTTSSSTGDANFPPSLLQSRVCES